MYAMDVHNGHDRVSAQPSGTSIALRLVQSYGYLWLCGLTTCILFQTRMKVNNGQTILSCAAAWTCTVWSEWDGRGLWACPRVLHKVMIFFAHSFCNAINYAVMMLGMVWEPCKESI